MMRASIYLPLDFEAFNTLDILVNAEIADVAANLRRLNPRAHESREMMEQHLCKLHRVRQEIEQSRPLGYVEMIRSLRGTTATATANG